MKTKLTLPVVLAGSVVLSGCFDGSDGVAPSTQVRVIHAVSDAPAVNVNIDGDVSVPGADFKQAAILNPALGSYSVSVDGILPDGSTTNVIQPTDLTFEAGIDYDIIATGLVEDGTVQSVVLDDDGQRSNSNSARLRVVHLSAEAAPVGEVEIYITVNGQPYSENPDFSFSFRESAGPLELNPADDYKIRVDVASSGTTVYESGEFELTAGSDLIVGAVDNTGANGSASPISLIVVNGEQIVELYDADQQSGVRVVHNSSDAPNVDVLLNDSVVTPELENLAYPQTAPDRALDSYVQVPVGTQNVKITPFNDNSDVRIEANLDFASGVGYTVIANGLLANIQALVLTDSVREIVTQASVRVVHGSTLAGPVNLYLLPDDQTMIGNAMPVRSGITFGQETGYLPVTPDTYNLVVTTSDGNVAIGPLSVSLEAGGIYTAVARDNDTFDGADLILLDDFVEPQT